MKFKSLILVFVSFLSISYANDFSQNFSDNKAINEDFVCELLSEFSTSIDRCVEGKIYIKPENIKSTSSGLFLNNNEKTLHMPVLFSDFYGPYIRMEEHVRPYSITYCIGCGWVKFSGDPCRNPNCKLKKK